MPQRERTQLGGGPELVRYSMRAERTAAQPPGSSARTSSASSTGCSTATTDAAATIPTAAVTQSSTLLTTRCAENAPRSRARSMASLNLASSNAASST
jgi:hypothetical protein